MTHLEKYYLTKSAGIGEASQELGNWMPDRTFTPHKSTGFLSDVGNAFKGMGNVFADPVVGVGKHGYGVVAGGEGGRGAQLKKLVGSVGLTGLTFVPGGRGVTAATRAGANLTRAEMIAMRNLQAASAGPRAWYNPVKYLGGGPRDAAQQLARRKEIYAQGRLPKHVMDDIATANSMGGHGGTLLPALPGAWNPAGNAVRNMKNTLAVNNPNWWRGMAASYTNPRSLYPWGVAATGAMHTAEGRGSLGQGGGQPGTNLFDVLGELGGQGGQGGQGGAGAQWRSWLPTSKSDEAF